MILAASAALSTFAIADDPASLRTQFQRAMDAHCAAIVRGDYAGAEKAMDGYFAPDCKIVNDGKSLSYKDWKAMLFQQLKMLKKVTVMKLTCTDVKINGAKATATTKVHMAGVLPNTGDKSVHTVDVEATSISTYAKRNGRWWCISDVDKTHTTKMDGKPIRM